MLKRLQKNIDKSVTIDYTSDCKYEINSQSLPNRLVRLIINKIDT